MIKTIRVASLLFAIAAVTIVLAACSGQGSGNASSTASSPGSSSASAPSAELATPAYYVFESITIDGSAIADPNQLVLDGDGGHFENWYYLSITLLDGENGKLCTFGSVADFTYTCESDVITLHVTPDFGYDGTILEIGEGMLTMTDDVGTTVLRQVDEPPTAFA